MGDPDLSCRISYQLIIDRYEHLCNTMDARGTKRSPSPRSTLRDSATRLTLMDGGEIDGGSHSCRRGILAID